MSIEDRTVQVRAREGVPMVPVHALVELQGELKSLSDVNYDKLKDSMLKRGFFAPVFVWAEKDTEGRISLRLLDGHQRLRTLKKMATEGYKVPAEIPAYMIDAADEIEARDKLLAIVSQYGKIEKEGLYEFLSVGQLDHNSIITDFELPEINATKFMDEFFSEPKVEDFASAKPAYELSRFVTCPHCEEEFNLATAEIKKT